MKMIDTSNLNKARKEIQKLKKEKKQIVVRAQDDEFNRKILENKDVDVFLGLEFHDRKDKLKQKDSGLNEVLCKFAVKNNIQIGINLKEVVKQPKKEKAILLARVMQNIALCKRTKTKMIIFPEKYKKQDVSSLFLTLGASTQQAKECFNF